jgi:hypothetical protein
MPDLWRSKPPFVDGTADWPAVSGLRADDRRAAPSCFTLMGRTPSVCYPDHVPLVSTDPFPPPRPPGQAGTHTKLDRRELDMGLGSTAKKLQKVTDMAEDVYSRLNDLRDQVVEMRETTRETSDRVDRLERETAEVRALVEALADDNGIDVERVTANAHIGEAEHEDAAAESEGDGDATVAPADRD